MGGKKGFRRLVRGHAVSGATVYYTFNRAKAQVASHQSESMTLVSPGSFDTGPKHLRSMIPDATRPTQASRDERTSISWMYPRFDDALHQRAGAQLRSIG